MGSLEDYARTANIPKEIAEDIRAEVEDKLERLCSLIDPETRPKEEIKIDWRIDAIMRNLKDLTRAMGTYFFFPDEGYKAFDEIIHLLDDLSENRQKEKSLKVEDFFDELYDFYVKKVRTSFMSPYSFHIWVPVANECLYRSRYVMRKYNRDELKKRKTEYYKEMKELLKEICDNLQESEEYLTEGGFKKDLLEDFFKDTEAENIWNYSLSDNNWLRKNYNPVKLAEEEYKKITKPLKENKYAIGHVLDSLELRVNLFKIFQNHSKKILNLFKKYNFSSTVRKFRNIQTYTNKFQECVFENIDYYKRHGIILIDLK